jgi:SAM-dependent methyltransferase
MIGFLKRALRRGLGARAGRRSPEAGDHPASPVAPDGRPFPPPELHVLVSGNKDLDDAAFWSIGKSCSDLITRILREHQIDLEECRAILDFGCGCGRIIRHFHELKRAEVYGTDYNPRLIDWCRRNLPFARFEVNRLYPPLIYRDAAFDFVYAFSVFTHLPEDLQVAWLAELSRVLAPGGHVLMTTQGAAYAHEYLDPPEQNRFETGHLVVLNEARAGKNECLVYHPESYVTGTLVKGLQVLDFIPGEVVDRRRQLIAQDAYLLRKPC